MRRLLPALWAAVLAAALSLPLQAGDGVKKKERTVRLGGEVYDSFTKARIKAAVTITSEDSALTLTDTCRIVSTWSSYGFDVPRRPARYFIRAEAEGYETLTDTFDLRPRGRVKYYSIPRLLMRRSQGDVYKSVGLGEVVVRGTRVQIAYRGDTIVYDASAFNLPEGSMLDALIRQMPGAELKDDGTVYVNGRKVDYLLLNGKDFFKRKNKMMLENLPYFTVKEVKVYDKSTERSEMLGRDVEPKDFVMDVGLKREYARSYIANAEAGAGTDNRWAARAFGLYFDDHTRVTLFGNANNVNENRRPGSQGDWSPAKMERGLLATKQAGLSIQTEDKDKRVRETFETSLTWSDSDNERHSSALTFASGGDIARGGSSFSRDKDFKLQANNSITLSKLKLTSHHYFTYTSGSGSASSRDSTLRDTLTNSSWSDAHNRYKRLNLTGSLDWNTALPWGDWVTFYANYGWYRLTPDESRIQTGTFYAADGTTDWRNRYNTSDYDNYYYNLNMAYRLTLDHGWNAGATVSYQQMHTADCGAQYRLDRLGGAWTGETWRLPSTADSLMMALDADNSTQTDKMQRGYGAALDVYRSARGCYISFFMPYTFYREKMRYRSGGTDTVAARTYSDFSPTVYLQWKKGKASHNYSLRVSTTQPDFASLMPRENTTNPLALFINNPALKGSTTVEIDGRSTFRRDSSDMTWYAGASVRIRHNAFGTRTTYNPATGAYTYMQDNVRGNWDARLLGGLNGSLGDRRRLRYSAGANVRLIRDVDFDVAYGGAGDALSKVSTVTTALDLSLTYTLGKLTAGVGGKIDTRHSRSRRDGFEPINTYDYRWGGNIQYTIPALGVNLSTDINMFSRRGYGSREMNTDDLAWNAQLSRTFLKGALTARITAYDILRQISTKSYSINAQGRTELRYNSVPRYVMLSLAWKFSKKPKGKK